MIYDDMTFTATPDRRHPGRLVVTAWLPIGKELVRGDVVDEDGPARGQPPYVPDPDTIRRESRKIRAENARAIRDGTYKVGRDKQGSHAIDAGATGVEGGRRTHRVVGYRVRREEGVGWGIGGLGDD